MLIASQLMLASHTLKVTEDRRAHLGIVENPLDSLDIRRLDRTTEDLPGINRKGIRLHAEDAHQEGLHTIPVDVTLSEIAQFREVDPLETFGRNILALGQLQHVLAAVDDHEPVLLVDLAHVARAEPAVLRHGLGCFLGVLEVLPEHHRSTQEQLAARERLVVHGVLHVRQRDETGLDGGTQVAAVAGRHVGRGLGHGHRVRLGHAVALDQIDAQNHAQEVLQRRVERRRPRDHGLGAVEPQSGGDLLAQDAVVQHVLVGGLGRVWVLEVGHFGGDHVARQRTPETRLLDRQLADDVAEAAVQTRYRDESRGTQQLHVVHELDDVAVEVADAGPGVEGPVLGHAGVDVRQRQIRQHRVAGLVVQQDQRTAGGRHGSLVRQHHPLGRARRAGRVVDGDHVRGRGRVRGSLGLGAQVLDLVHRVDGYLATGHGLQQSPLRVAILFACIQWIQADDELEVRQLGLQLEQRRDMRQ